MSKDYARSLDKIHHKILQDLVKHPTNSFCADCAMRGALSASMCRCGPLVHSPRATPDPTWASANLGIFLCLNCSGSHRSIGVHISQVRSITMDAWFPDQIETMKTVGNARARAIWEGKVPAGMHVPDENSNRTDMDVWIRDKYVNKKYFKPCCPADVEPVPMPRQFSQKGKFPAALGGKGGAAAAAVKAGPTRGESRDAAAVKRRRKRRSRSGGPREHRAVRHLPRQSQSRSCQVAAAMMAQ
eukprot:COSAG05_NODE_4908_length_1331_cov_0.832792_1_plen_243_part_00